MFKKLLCVAAIAAFFASCNVDAPPPTTDDAAALQKNNDDSIHVILDSLNKTSIYVPPLYDKRMFDTAATSEFYALAKATHGELKVLVNSRLLTTEITRIIKEHGADNADLLILIDKTSSMEDDIEVVKKGLRKIIASISEYHNVHLGIGLYGDKNYDGEGWFSFKDFGTNYSTAQAFVNAIQVTGGGDNPESVYDGFFLADEQNFWRSGTKKMVLLIGDAPSLEKPLGDHTLADVIEKANEDKITTNFYPIIVTPSMDGGAEEAAVAHYKEATLINNLFPNPSNGNITVAFTQSDDYTLAIFDYTGKQVYTEKFNGQEWKKDLSGTLHTGAYILRAMSRNTSYQTLKFIIL